MNKSKPLLTLEELEKARMFFRKHPLVAKIPIVVDSLETSLSTPLSKSCDTCEDRNDCLYGCLDDGYNFDDGIDDIDDIDFTEVDCDIVL